MDIDDIIRRARRDSRCVSGSETRALCDEIDRLRKMIHGAYELLAIVLDDLKEVEAAAGEGEG